MAVTKMPTKYGKFRAYGYVNRLNGEHHVALVKGEIGGRRKCTLPCTFRVPHRRYLLALRCDCGQQFAAAMTQIEREGRGFYFTCGRKAAVSD